MNELVFDKMDALEAIRLAKKNGIEWLYENNPGPGGKMRKSTTGFLLHRGASFPVKSLGRLANKIAGKPMLENPVTDVFRKYFEELGFELISNLEDEAESADERQRRQAELWARPGQAKFRQAVFELFGARCLVSGCEVLSALEAAHILPVYANGPDEGWNGIPLRADLHRLFDSGLMEIDPNTWKVLVIESARKDYERYHGLELKSLVSKTSSLQKLSEALQKRAKART